jgi:hypothetical protein
LGGNIRFVIGEITLEGELFDTPAAKALANLLPATLHMTRWGGEYFGPMLPPLGEFPEDDLVEILEPGALAYWEPGEALCLFFGPTPASESGELRAASPVHPVGRVNGGLDALFGLGNTVTAEIFALEDDL